MWVPKKSALEASRRELSGDLSFGIGILLVDERSSLNNPKSGVIYTVLYGKSLAMRSAYMSYVPRFGVPATATCLVPVLLLLYLSVMTIYIPGNIYNMVITHSAVLLLLL